MSRMGKSIRKVAKKIVVDTSPSQYAAEGKKVVCSHCGSDVFVARRATIALMDFGWSAKSPRILACTKCGKIQWFLKEPQLQSS
jgi:hypothetical protein